MPTILDQIVQTKHQEVAAAKSKISQDDLRAQCRCAPPPRNFFAAVTKPPANGALINLIAEVKQKSPSAGLLAPPPQASSLKAFPFDPAQIARNYHAAGADALSVLTDENYFGGHLSYINLVKAAVPLPVLRKDFIIDPYQIYEARANGADAVLLIAEILTDSLLLDLQILAAELRLTTLIEVHELDSLLRVRSAIGFPLRSYSLLGINNRDLKTFTTDLATTLRLAEFIDDKQILVSESGIKSKADVQRLAAANIRTLLIGETLMRSPDIAQEIANLKGILRQT
jgi:indole-3-glycerol phosphate synthase